MRTVFSPSIARYTGCTLATCAAVCLWLAFQYPFVSSQFSLDLPGWIPDFYNAHARIERWVIDTGNIQVGPRYLGGMITDLFRGGERLIGTAVLCFSVIFPSLKILATILILLGSGWLSNRVRSAAVWCLGHLFRFSMGDVFLVGLVILFFKAPGFNYVFKSEPGLYFYATSALLGYIAAALVQSAKPRRPEPGLQQT